MGVNVRVELKGLPDVIRKLASWRDKKANACARAIEQTAQDIVRDAKILCPVKTGRLRGSLIYKTSWGKGATMGVKTEAGDELRAPEIEPGTLTAVIGTNVFYAPFVEFGHSTAAHGGRFAFAHGPGFGGRWVEGRFYLSCAYYAHETDVQRRIAAALGQPEAL